jgi:hypothetical protein
MVVGLPLLAERAGSKVCVVTSHLHEVHFGVTCCRALGSQEKERQGLRVPLPVQFHGNEYVRLSAWATTAW